VWRFIGWDDSSRGTSRDSSNRTLASRIIESRDDSDATHYLLTAPNRPKRQVLGFQFGREAAFPTITVRDLESGSKYMRQPTVPGKFTNTNITGFLRLNGKWVVAVKQLTSTTFTVYDTVDHRFDVLGVKGREHHQTLFEILDNESADPIRVEQVWIETGRTGDLMAKLMLSTGKADYNVAGYDVYPLGMGCALPYGLLDVNSILGIGDEPYVLFLEKPTAFVSLLESALVLRNYHLVWKSGKMTVVTPSEESASASSIVRLTENNKAQQVSRNGALSVNTLRTACNRQADSIVNRVTLKYNRLAGGEYARTISLGSQASQTDYAQVRSAVVEGVGVYDDFHSVANGGGIHEWVDKCASSALAYFRNPVAIIVRTFDASMVTRLYPGTRVQITDSAIVNPATGTRGITGVLGWVTATSFDWSTGIGQAAVIFAPSFASTKLAPYGASARVDETVNTGGYTRGFAVDKITVKAHEYSESSDPVDASFYAASEGDRVRVVELSPENPAFPIEVGTSLITSVVGNEINFDNMDPSGSPALTSGYYVVQHLNRLDNEDDFTHAFLSDPTTKSTGLNTRDFYVFSGARELYKTDTIDYTQRYRKRNKSDYAQGAIVSTHKFKQARDFYNQALAYHSVQPLVTWKPEDATTALSTTDATNYKLLFAQWIPLYGGGKRSLYINLYATSGHASNQATVKYVTSTGVVRGLDSSYKDTSTNPLSWPDGGQNSLSLAVPAGTGYSYLGESTLRPAVLASNTPGCWLYILLKAATSGTSGIKGIFVREGFLS